MFKTSVVQIFNFKAIFCIDYNINIFLFLLLTDFVRPKMSQPEFLDPKDPAFFCLRANFTYAHELYLQLKDLPEDSDFLLFKIVLEDIHNLIGVTGGNICSWRQGASRAGELYYLRHEIKDFELKVFYTNDSTQTAFNKHSDQFIGTCAKFGALFNEGRQFPFSPDL